VNLLRSIADLHRVDGPLYLAIGVFDGVHLGHQAVIQCALDHAKAEKGTAVVVTFDPHPARVLRPDQAPRLLTATEHKIRLIATLGVEHLLTIHFDRAFAETPPAEFIHQLAEAAHPLEEICVGYEWCFGKGRAGNLELLRTLGDELGFREIGVPAVKIDDQIVSSTLIRSAVEAGDLIAAARYLGREYTILGSIVVGDKLGRKLGFPTANISAHSEQFPPNGVYAVEAQWREQRLGGVANIGVRPTIQHANGHRLLEVHLFDFDGDVYGEEIEVSFRHRLRGEKKFAGLDELRAQIARDAGEARALLSAANQ
jgi:riboflavin kinase/FMN adenylyltransferase